MACMQPASPPCPCGRLRSPGRPNSAALPYVDCCGRWHGGPAFLQAPDAESLMRSRYSAFVLGRAEYLLATWHPSTRPAVLGPDEPGLRWLGLTVKQHLQQDADHASVAFVARSKLAGRAHRLEENSRFVREHEAAGPRWYYLDAQA